MKRVALITVALLTVLLLAAPPVVAQTTSSFIVKGTTKTSRFLVDGKQYIGQASFLWPAGSKHILEYPVADDGFQYNDLRNTRQGFSGWTDNLNRLQPTSARVQTITADPAISSYTATDTLEYLVLFVLMDGSVVPPATTITQAPTDCSAPGTPNPGEFRVGVVFVGSTCVWNSAQFWMTPGQYALNAFPYPGYVFLGWKADFNPPDAFLRGFAVTGPMVIHARFSPAKRVKFRTDPPGLKVLVDRAEVFTTDVEPCAANNRLPPGAPKTIAPLCIGEFDFAPGSPHVFGAVTPQLDRVGKNWVFDSFSNGMTNNSLYTTPDTIYPEETITVKYVRGVQTTVITKPSGLKVSVDGRDNWAETYFVFAPGKKISISAAPEQVDARGRKYVFKSWSNGGTATQDVIIPDKALDGGIQLIAEYDLLSQVVVRSNPVGSDVIVDGTRCPTPCKVDRPDGTDVRLSALATSAVGEASRLDFVSWSDGAARERTVKVAGADPGSLTVNYQASNKLAIGVDPPEGAKIRVTPDSADRFFTSDTTVVVTAEEQPGFRFRRWDIDLTGTSSSSTLSMNRPRTIIARLDKVPFIAPTGIRNAAGQTPDGVVAPGSIISILGALLAPYYEAGPAGPILSQALAGTSVVVGDRILPLLFVSPDRIDAQLPRDLTPGEYQLRVVRVGQADVVGKFTATAAAPGIFNQSFDDQSYAVGQREDGTDLAPDKPLKRGETITLKATGFGGYELSHPTGFALPALPPFPAQFPVEVWLGETKLDTIWAGGASGQAGIDLVKFKLPGDLPDGPMNASVKLRVQGEESNVVLLPIE